MRLTRRRQLVELDGMAMAVFTFAGGVLIGTGGSWQNALSVGSLLLGLAFMARLLRSETGDVWSRPLYKKPDRRPSPELRETLDGVLEAIEEEDARRQAKRQRLLVFLAPLEAAQRQQDELEAEAFKPNLQARRPGPKRKIEASTLSSD